MTTLRHSEKTATPEVGDAQSRSPLAEDVHWFCGSKLGVLYRAAMIEQVAHPAVAAAVDRTGRFAANFTDRSIRSFAQTLLMEWGDPADTAAEIEKVKRLHRLVKGKGRGEFAGTRYSALMPELWTWVALSSTINHYNSYIAGPGMHLDDQQREEVYREIYRHMKTVELNGSTSRLPDNLADARAMYEEIVTTQLQSNDFFRMALENFNQPPVPTIGLPPRTRALLKPVWPIISRTLARPQIICSLGVCHPTVRELLEVEWRARHQLEFAIYCHLVRLAWEHAPKRATLLAIAFNRWQYQQLRRSYSSVVLDTYAPLTDSEVPAHTSDKPPATSSA